MNAFRLTQAHQEAVVSAPCALYRSVVPDLLFEDVQEARIFPQKAVSFTYKAFGTLLAALQGAPIRHLHFTGGEATLVRDLPRMLGLAREWGVERLSITSNGTLRLRLSLPGVTLRTPGQIVRLQALHVPDLDTWQIASRLLDTFLHAAKR